MQTFYLGIDVSKGYADFIILNNQKKVVLENFQLDDTFDNILIMKTDNADIASFNLDTGKYKEFKAKKGATTTLTTDGKYVYVYEDKVVTKVSTE